MGALSSRGTISTDAGAVCRAVRRRTPGVGAYEQQPEHEERPRWRRTRPRSWPAPPVWLSATRSGRAGAVRRLPGDARVHLCRGSQVVLAIRSAGARPPRSSAGRDGHLSSRRGQSYGRRGGQPSCRAPPGRSGVRVPRQNLKIGATPGTCEVRNAPGNKSSHCGRRRSACRGRAPGSTGGRHSRSCVPRRRGSSADAGQMSVVVGAQDAAHHVVGQARRVALAREQADQAACLHLRRRDRAGTAARRSTSARAVTDSLSRPICSTAASTSACSTPRWRNLSATARPASPRSRWAARA